MRRNVRGYGPRLKVFVQRLILGRLDEVNIPITNARDMGQDNARNLRQFRNQTRQFADEVGMIGICTLATVQKDEVWPNEHGSGAIVLPKLPEGLLLRVQSESIRAKFCGCYLICVSVPMRVFPTNAITEGGDKIRHTRYQREPS